jgi:DNA repair exonuclease SbcCD ATPase subunit
MAKNKDGAPLRIIGLYAENFKRLVAVEIKPTGNVVEISGPNEAGKSSILDAIWAALGGKESIPDMPIRKGETEAVIKLDLGEYTVTRTFKMRDDGKTWTTGLRVENADGFRAQDPQTTINGLLGKFTFDPLEFDRMKMRDKFETMRGFAPDVDFDAIAKADEKDRQERTVVNREAKALSAQVAAIVIPEGAPTEKADEAALVDELAAVGEHNAQIERRKDRRTATAKEANDLDASAAIDRERAESLRKEAETLDKAANDKRAKAADLRQKLGAAETLPEPKDAAEVRGRLDEAKRTNALVDLRDKRAALEAQHSAKQAASEALTVAIENREADKRKAIAAAKLPVDGLEFGDGVILLNGIPLDQCSAAQRLRTSVAIAMAANPRLRVLRISEGSLLDSNGMKILAEMCEGRNYQAFVERVADDAKAGFFIEAGRVREREQKAAA